MHFYTAALQACEEHGFGLAGFFPVKGDNRGAVIEFDCVMIRRGAVQSH